MSYKKVGWEDSPSSNTPILSVSLNQMDDGIEKANKGIVFGYSATFTSDGVLKNATSTEALDSGSFATGQTDIVTAFVADNVTKINNGTFSNCTSLKTIYINNTVGNVDIVSGAVPSGVSIVYSNAEKFINVNELLASAIKSLKSLVNTNRTDWENRATSIETQHKTDVTELSQTIQKVKESALEEFASVKADVSTNEKSIESLKADFNKSVDVINTTLDTKENVSNKVSVITHPSIDYYPDTKAVFDYVNSKLETPLSDIEDLKSNKLDKTDFNTYKTATDKAVGDKADNIVCSTDKASSCYLNDSSKNHIKGLSLYGNSMQSEVPTPTVPVNIENVNNPNITLYQKNLFDTSKAIVSMNSKAQLVEWDRQNCSLTFTSNADTINSGPFFRHTTLIGVSQGYGVDYTRLNGKSVTLSFDIQSNTDCKINVQFTKYSNTCLDISTTKQRLSVTEVVDTRKLNKALCFYLNNVGATVTISNIQIEVNNTATDYEVCDVNKVEINCTLCKVNNVVDTLAVNADGTGYITQNLLYERITSGRSQSGHMWQYSTVSKRFYRDDTRFKANYGVPNLLCSHFKVADNERDTTLDETIGFTAGTGTGIAIRMLQFDGDVTAWESWLDSNEVYVLVPLKKPIVTELSKDQVDKILSLYTYYPSTTVVSDCDSQLTYIAEPKNYIDNKILEVATALVAHESEVM